MRALRRLIVTLLVLVAIAVGLDRLAAHLAASYVAEQVQRSQHLAQEPDISIGGFPFLTQVAAGRYDDVTATVTGLRTSRLRVTRLRVELYGVYLPASAVIHQTVRSVPVDRARATVVLSYADLNAALPGALRLSYAGSRDSVAVTGRADVAGFPLSVRASASVGIQGSSLVISPTGAASALRVALDLSGLPFGLRLTGVHANRTGVSIGASARNLVLRR